MFWKLHFIQIHPLLTIKLHQNKILYLVNLIAHKSLTYSTLTNCHKSDENVLGERSHRLARGVMKSCTLNGIVRLVQTEAPWILLTNDILNYGYPCMH